MTIRINLNRKDEIGRLAQSFQRLVDDTRIVIEGIQKSAMQLQAASVDVSSHEEITTAMQRIAELSSRMRKTSTEVNKGLQVVKQAGKPLMRL